jgi:hypothetical protein
MASKAAAGRRLGAARERAASQAAQIDPVALGERLANARTDVLVAILGAGAAGMATLYWQPTGGDVMTMGSFLVFAVSTGGALGALAARVFHRPPAAVVTVPAALPPPEAIPPVEPLRGRPATPAGDPLVVATPARAEEGPKS